MPARSRFWIVAIASFAALIMAGWVAAAQGLIATLMLKPHHTFSEEQQSPAPDYSSNAAWAALPGAHENGSGAAQTAATNVFFLYPTTYLSPQSWNAAFQRLIRKVSEVLTARR